MSSRVTIPVSLMLDHRGRFVELISRHFPLPAKTLARHGSWLDWTSVSQNVQIEWSATLIESYSGRLHWNQLPREALRVVDLDQLIAAVRAGRLSASRLILAIEDRPSFERCLAYYEAEHPSGVGGLSRSAELLWTAELIAAHVDRLDWSELSSNPGLPWSLELIRAFESRWDWPRLCSQPPWGFVSEDAPWTVALLDEFEDHLQWFGGRHALVDSVVWTPQLFERHRVTIEAAYVAADRFTHDWTYATSHEHFTAPFVEHLLELEQQRGVSTVDWDKLSAAATRPWTDDFITRHRLRLSTRALFCNPAFPWRKYAHIFEPNPQKLADIVATNAHALPPDRVVKWNQQIDARFEYNPKLTVEHVLSMWGWKSRSLVELTRLARAAGLSSSTLVSEVPARLAAALDLESVEAFLLALARLGDRRNPGLESAIATNLEQPEAYGVYADWLEAQGNASHAELLRALDEPERAKLQADFERSFALDKAVWKRGFVNKAVLRADWRNRLTHSLFALLEALRIPASCFAVDAELANQRPRTLIEDDWRLLGTLACLRRLALTDMEIASTRGLAQLPALTDLDLTGLSISHGGLDGLAGAPELRRLCLAASPSVHDLAPLAKLSNLVWLSLYGTATSDLSPLRACSRLTELDLRRTQISDIEPLEQLQRLRTLHLHENSPVSNAALARLRRANPRLQIEFGGSPFAKPVSIDLWFWVETRLRLK